MTIQEFQRLIEQHYLQRDRERGLFETFTWSQLGLHTKPIGMLNVAGYYDGLLSFLDNAVTERFLRPHHRSMLLVADQPAALLEAMAGYEPPTVAKWIDRDSS